MYAKIYDSEQQGSCWCDMIACCFPGTPPHAASSSKKPRSRGIFHSLFCCLCHDETDHVPVNNNAPLLVDENGTISKVRVISFFVTSILTSRPELSRVFWIPASSWLTLPRATWSSVRVRKPKPQVSFCAILFLFTSCDSWIFHDEN